MESRDSSNLFSEPIFPNTDQALDDPNGLLASGGLITPIWLDRAYRQGIFPWNDPDEARLWWSPAPRSIITPESFHIPKSVRKEVRRTSLRITSNLACQSVIKACAEPRKSEPNTWIDQEILKHYPALIHSGRALSIECWNTNGELVGGFYGLLIGCAFFGESMFSRESGASKVAFAITAPLLFELGIRLIDCQIQSEHMARFGLLELPREDFEALLDDCTKERIISPLPGVIR